MTSYVCIELFHGGWSAKFGLHIHYVIRFLTRERINKEESSHSLAKGSLLGRGNLGVLFKIKGETK